MRSSQGLLQLIGKVSYKRTILHNFKFINIAYNTQRRNYASEAETTAEIHKKVPTKVVNYTYDTYPHLKRNPNFKELSPNDIKFFQSILSSNEIIIDNGNNQDDLLPYNIDWMKKYRGKSRLVAKPKTTEQIAKLVKYCNENKLAIVPQGGNTGLVGTLVCDAGCILEVLDNYLAERGYMVPLDLGAKGSCHIGGNVATNAGGLRLLRYGSLHGNVLGLEVVLPDGTILENLSTLRKDNTGYDLKQLFIGSEGTLGIITGVSILTPRRPKSVNVAVFCLNSFQNVQEAFNISKGELTEILSAFEFWDINALRMVKHHLFQGTNLPLEDKYPFYVLVETSGSNKEHNEEKLHNFMEILMTKGVVEDGVVAQDNTQIQNLWLMREGIPEAGSKSGSVYKYDLSIPLPVFYNIVEDMSNRLKDAGIFGKDKPVTDVCGYGHVGDGNIHLNIVAKSYSPEITKLIEPYVYEWTAKYKGSVSAEHGLGLMKADCIGYSKSQKMISIMKQIKQTIDPNVSIGSNIIQNPAIEKRIADTYIGATKLIEKRLPVSIGANMPVLQIYI
ncbi:14745_t:CDS:10 [Gigaspora margarita]|uniref:14745_t:CDS:1 n=1 Tax=Gigaspora margarita TaxID=4874 RepID=A0ABN7UUH8_GIGMA|nr:14745_t:CDS:10 [Gigaspora margarita]